MNFRAGCLTILGFALPTALLAGSLSWPQFDLDSRHDGLSQQETTIHAGNVATLHLIPGYPVTLPSVADGAPAFLSAVQTGSGRKDLLYLTTRAGHLLAIDAATGLTQWSRQPATTPNYTTSSPAIDPSQLFVYSYGLDGKVHKYQVGDGTEITTGGWPEVATLKPAVEKGSAALSIVTAQSGTAYLVVANGGYPGDAGDYQGHVTVINLATGAQQVFNADCSNLTVHFVQAPGTPDCVGHVQSAIWARPGVVYDSSLDLLFMATGNGDFDANLGGHDWGDSVFALHPDGTGNGLGSPVDSYTPTEFATLQSTDADLGSTAPAILPSPNGSNVAHLGVQGGKDAQLRLLNLANLSGAGGPGHLGGELQKMAVPQGGQVLTQPAVWTNPADGKIWVFVANGGGISGLKLTVGGTGNPLLASQWASATGGTSPIVVNGILYYSSYASGLRALNPATGAQLWSSPTLSGPSGLHWESPIVVGGRLFATDDTGHLLAYAPDPEPLNFFALAPCRVLDTRNPVGTYGGPSLQGGGALRNFPLFNQCGVPIGARAVAATITVIAPGSAGFITVGPTGVSLQTSNLNFAAGVTRANNAVLALTGNPLGSLTVQTGFTGTADLALDVVGYFQ